MRNNYILNDILDDYHSWLVSLVDCDEMLHIHYTKLMDTLNDIPYEWQLPMDEFRYLDGLELRERFDYEFLDSGKFSVADELRGKTASVLEVLCALCDRYSSEILCDPDDSGVASEIFFEVLLNLDLVNFDDDFLNFQTRVVFERANLSNFRVKPFGKFSSKNVDLWSQCGHFCTAKYI